MVFVDANVTSLMMDAIDLSTAMVYLMHIDDSTALRPGGRKQNVSNCRQTDDSWIRSA